MRSLSELINSINAGESSAHAYTIEGPSGKTRDSFVKELAAGLECLDGDAGSRPCGRCDACRQVAAGTSLDVVHMQMSGKTSYKTEDANAFAERLDMGAYGRYLIGIIDDAGSLSEIVQNKLLKTLEEPRQNVLLFLCTSNRDHLLSTVRSRCGGIRLADYTDVFDEEDAESREAVSAAAELLAQKDALFCDYRESIEKNVKTKEDAQYLIDAAEDILRERMISGSDPAAAAAGIELAERARSDTEQGMDKIRALKRLFLELR